jgi:hypothetical protein
VTSTWTAAGTQDARRRDGQGADKSEEAQAPKAEAVKPEWIEENDFEDENLFWNSGPIGTEIDKYMDDRDT